MAAIDLFTNFGEVVANPFSSSATTITLASGDGSRLPSGIFRVTFWNATDYAKASDDPNREIIGVAVRTGDSLTSLSRGIEGTSAANHNTAGKTYRGTLSITAATLTTINTYIEHLDKSAFRAYQGSNLTVAPNTDVKLALDQEDFDTSNEFTPWNAGSISTTGRYTVGKASIVQYTVSAYIASITGGNSYNIRIKKNGTQVANGRTVVPASGDHQLLYTDLISLAAGDYIEAYFRHGDGVDRTISSGRELTFFAGAVVGTARRT